MITDSSVIRTKMEDKDLRIWKKKMAFNRWFDEYFCDTQGEESPYSYEDVENAFSIGWKNAELKAVEWLKENIQIEQEGEFVIKVKDVNKLIDEAFVKGE